MKYALRKMRIYTLTMKISSLRIVFDFNYEMDDTDDLLTLLKRNILTRLRNGRTNSMSERKIILITKR